MLGDSGYRAWAGGLRPRILRWWPLTRTGMSLVLRRRVFWLFLLLGLANFLFYSSMVYVFAQFRAELAKRGVLSTPFFSHFVFTGSGDSYREFITLQAVAVLLLLGFAGSILVGNDFRFRSLSFYLSRPLGKLDYFLGKLGAVSGLAALVTLAPALLLYLEYGLFTESLDYFRESIRTGLAIIAYGLLVSVASATLLLGIAALLQRTLLIVVAWGAIFVFLPLMGEIFARMAAGPGEEAWAWRLLDFWRVLWWISDAFFATGDAAMAQRLPWAVGVLLAWMALSIWVFSRRVRALEVVR